MVELHANSNRGMALTFKGGLARALLWPGRGPRAVVTVIALLIWLALQAWDRDFGLWFWLLGLVPLLFYLGALSSYPARLAMAGVSVEAIRRALSQKGYTQVAALEPESWRVPTLPWVTPSDPRFDVTLDPANGVVEGPWAVLRRISRSLKAAGAG
ncbi:MAG: hypothetical protein IM669_10525 [Phenylobacterium sp.]|jgi:hypothetical protein|uniref:hypothetical protein n=1 Tax=Phenylobacterium sp. TaxID=1871053 RepID=UPI0025D826BD|nr:hypothetical protein [Phenylobacterium sp.]MCA3757942.1 hypothetical protein [Phenylobacterium sp.]